MALDSLTKRAAVMGVARPWMRSKNPDVGLSESWRVATGNAYPVASFGTPVVFEGLINTPWVWDLFKVGMYACLMLSFFVYPM